MGDLLFKLVKHSFRRSAEAEEIVLNSYLTRTNFNVPAQDVRRSFAYGRRLLKEVVYVLKTPGSADLVGTHLHVHNTNRGQDSWNKFLMDFFPAISGSVNLGDFTAPRGVTAKLALLWELFLSVPVYLLLRAKWPGSAQNLLTLPKLLVRLAVMRQRISKGTDIYYSGVYEPESNVYAYWLIKKGCRVSFFISGTPLKRYLTQICCSRLYLSNAYQKEESAIFHQTIHAGEVNVLPPFSHKELDYNVPSNKPVYDVAVYTTGIWKRKEEGIFYDAEVGEKESRIFGLLDNFISETGTSLRIIVFCHPVEKRDPRDYERARVHYLSGRVNRSAFFFAPAEDRTVKHFGNANVAVTSISNTLFERLYAGHKVLIIRKQDDWFPHAGSRLQAITSFSTGDFYMKLVKFLAMPADEYFTVNGIQAYRGTGVHVRPGSGMPLNH